MSQAKILLVDDARIFQEIQRDFLRFSPVSILTAHNGEEALAIMKSERPDLLVMDVNMPHMDGVACCKAIRKVPALSSLPVILVATSSGADDMASYRDAGCNGILHKPLQRREFLNRVHSFLPAVERREPRVPCRVTVSIETRTGTFIGMSHDIAVNGLFVATDYVVDPGSEVVLSFTLPTCDDKVTVVWGRVAWCNNASVKSRKSLPSGLGVEFLEITGQDGILARSNELAAFVAANGAP
jgi:CheY-like chemotaxis protein/Tfp pilus assembly protein PilZ